MPELTVTHIALLVAVTIIGMVLGWIARSSRSNSEKNAINAGWQEQLEAQRAEHDRLVDQNKSLMEQNSQYQASNKDSRNRSTELSEALKEASERRDELQRQIKEIRSELETTVTQRDQLQSEAGDAGSDELDRRDATIERLTSELRSWQERVPPLVERFRVRNEEAQQLEEELVEAREKITALENMVGSDSTRVEPVDPEALGDDLYASNDATEESDPVDDELSDVVSIIDEAFADDDDEQNAGETEDDSDAVAEFEDAFAAAEDSDDDESDAEEDDADIEVDELEVDEEIDDDSYIAEVLPFVGADDDDDDDSSIDAEHDDAAEDADDEADDDASSDYEASSDNLKRIKGIGPSIEKTLNEMGIWRFEQIADMSEYDIDRVARRLKGFRSRIYREDWIGQARSLFEEQQSRQA